LFAQVLLLDFEESLGVVAFDSGDEEAEKATKEIADTTEHMCSLGGQAIFLP